MFSTQAHFFKTWLIVLVSDPSFVTISGWAVVLVVSSQEIAGGWYPAWYFQCNARMSTYPLLSKIFIRFWTLPQADKVESLLIFDGIV